MPGSADEAPSEETLARLLEDPDALEQHLARTLPPPGTTFAVDVEYGALPEQPREAAVLLPLYQREGRPYLLFTLRAPSLARHSGQISFPGGSRDPEDSSIVAAALRETHEEIGVPPASVHVLGVLRPVFTVVSNFLISPVVGWIGDEPLHLEPNPGEVAEVIEVPLAHLVDPAIFHAEVWQRGGHDVTVYFYDYGDYRIWGATARIVHDLLRVLRGRPVDES